MVTPRELINTMRVYKCSATEAYQFMNNDANKAFIFSSGEVYIPYTWSSFYNYQVKHTN